MTCCDFSVLKVHDKFLCKYNILENSPLLGCAYSVNNSELFYTGFADNYHCMTITDVYSHEGNTLAVKCTYTYYPEYDSQILWMNRITPGDVLSIQSVASVLYPPDYCKWHQNFQIGDKVYVIPLPDSNILQIGILARINGNGTGCILLENGTSVTAKFNEVCRVTN